MSFTRIAGAGLGMALMTLLTLPAPVSSSGTRETRESRYTVHTRGFKVGELKTSCSIPSDSPAKVLRFTSDIRINANLLVYSYSLESREEALVGEEGAFRYTRSDRENSRERHVEGRLENGSFRFRVTENGSTRTVAINRDCYEATTMECPETGLKREGDELALRLLDMETLTVVLRRYKWVRSEDVRVAGKLVRCRVIEFEDPNKKCTRWIRPDEVGVIIARQDGKGKNGSYSLRMIDYSALK